MANKSNQRNKLVTREHKVGVNCNSENELHVLQAKQYEGPIPAAEELQRYKEISPDLPNRILTVFEEDSKHTRDMGRRALEGSINFDKRSQLMAFTIIIVGLLGTFFLAYLDKDIASIITGLGTIALIFKGVFSKNNNGK